MEVQLIDNKRYERYKLSEGAEIFRGYLKEYEIDEVILRRLSKDLGFSYELYSTLYTINKESAEILINSMSKQNKHPEIIFLVDDESHQVLDYTLEYDRTPVLNSEFIKRVLSLSETSEDIEVSELYYSKDNKISSIILKKKSPVVIEEKYENKSSNHIEYNIGVLLVNDEVNTTYSRLVLYLNHQPYYLPASYYSTTTSRYKRSTSSSSEALEVLVLKVIEDLRENTLYNKLYDFHFKYRYNKNVFSTYEEYNSVLRVMRRIPAIIEDNSFLGPLLSTYEDFEKKYSGIEDQKSSYIWRCTAFSDITIGSLVSIISSILDIVYAPSIDYFEIRDLVGSYLSTNRIAGEIAKENSI